MGKQQQQQTNADETTGFASLNHRALVTTVTHLHPLFGW
jgi:hypothetical protein